jgi:hypothetical protein
MGRVPLHRIARARAGDKGDALMLAVVARDPADHPVLVREVTEARVRERLGGRVTGSVRRHVLPRLDALLFVCEGALAGGVTASTTLDGHGKALGPWLLGMSIETEEGQG